MAKSSYHIINKATKQSIYNDSYDTCIYVFTNKHRLFRQTHKIISDEEYQKIIKKKPIL